MRIGQSTALTALVVLVACSAPVTSPVESRDAAVSSPVPSLATAVPSATVLPSPSDEAAPAWVALDSSGPAAREDHTWTVDPARGVAYLHGGRDGETVFGDLWAFDLASDAWSEITVAEAPAARFGHEAVWADGIGMVVFAGQAGTTFFNDLWAFDPNAGSWSELPSSGAVPRARYGTCAAIGPDGRLWISHGFTEDQTRFADTVAYDFDSGTWTDETPEPPVPVNRCLHGCWWTDEDGLALFGGQTTGTTALGDHWVLADGVWAMQEGTLPAARNLYARARLSGATLVFGGQAVDASYLADSFVFRDGDDGIVEVNVGGEGPSPRAGAEMVVDPDRDRVLLFGGRDADGAYADLWELVGLHN